MFKKQPFFVLFFSFMIGQFVNANRIEAMKDRPACAIISDAMRGRCPGLNQRMQDQGCITNDERISLDKNSWGAMCELKDLIGVCHCSCFDPSTRVLVENIRTNESSWVVASDLLQKHEQYRIYVLETGSFVAGQIKLETFPFKILPCDSREVLSLEMTNGSVLKVTFEHPVLLPSGTMAQAQKLKVGDKLKNYLGHEITIKTITNEMSSGDVLNILVDEEHQRSPHVIVADGLLVGDAQWQRLLLGVEKKENP